MADGARNRWIRRRDRAGREIDALLARVWRRRPAGNVAMFHQGRSGSTVLGQMLARHPAVRWDGEAYAPAIDAWVRERGPFRGGLAGRRADFDPVAHTRAQLRRTVRPWYGFEIKPFHVRFCGLELAAFVDALEGLGFSHFVHLQRENTLQMVVSSAVAARTGHYQRRRGEPARRVTIELDPSAVESQGEIRPLLQVLDDQRRDRERLAELLASCAPLTLTYERDVEPDPRIGYRRICALLGLKARSAAPGLDKANPFPLRERVSNFAALADALRATDYAWMLDER